MSRYLRRHCPGGAFHITARLMRGPHLLTEPLRDSILPIIDESMCRTDASLLGFAIMSNHVHFILRQGDLPLSRTIQPILRRIALLVHKEHRTAGHVFERTYHDKECRSADHLRDAITYTHLNPVRARLCAHPEQYKWSSHQNYASCDGSMACSISVDAAREMFCVSRKGTESDHAKAYSNYVAYRISCDRADAMNQARTFRPPELAAANEYWDEEYASRDLDNVAGKRSRRADLRDIANRIVMEKAPGLPLDALRGRNVASRQLQLLRYEIIQDARNAGYSGASIASFLVMSAARVSEISRATVVLKKYRSACTPG